MIYNKPRAMKSSWSVSSISGSSYGFKPNSNGDTSKVRTRAYTALPLPDESKQLILPMPASASLEAYSAAGIQATGQGANSLTFTCQTVPTAAVDVWVSVQEVQA